MENIELKVLRLVLFSVFLACTGTALHSAEYNLANCQVVSSIGIPAYMLDQVDAVVGSHKQILSLYFRKPAPEKPVIKVSSSVREFSSIYSVDWQNGGVYGDGVIGIQPVDILKSKGSLDTVLRHEYTHYFLDRNFPGLPAFFQEGIAAYFGGMNLEKGLAVLPENLYRWEDQSVLTNADQGLLRRMYSSARYFIMERIEKYGRTEFLNLLNAGKETVLSNYRDYFEKNTYWIRVLVNPRGENRFTLKFPAVCSLSGISDNGTTVINTITNTNEILMEYTNGSISLNGVLYREANLSFPDVFRLGERSFRQSLMVNIDGTNMNLINVIPLEYYLFSVVVSEMPSDSKEALKVQAVLSRSLALNRIRTSASKKWDVNILTGDQSYRGQSWETEAARKAVMETDGEVMVWNGQLEFPYFSSTCSGWTADPKDVWGKSVPYLKAVQCFYSGSTLCSISPHFPEWSRDMAEDELSSIIGFPVTNITFFQTDPHGRVKIVQLNDKLVTFDSFKSVVSKAKDWNFLKSNLVSVTKSSGSFRFKGQGFGHGVGLCQYGAIKLAEKNDYRFIIRFYFQNSSIEQYRPEMPVYQE